MTTNRLEVAQERLDVLRTRMFEVRKKILVRQNRSVIYRRRLFKDYLLYGGQYSALLDEINEL